MANASEQQGVELTEDVQIRLWPWSVEHTGDLNVPFVTAGNRVYSVANQNGEFPEIGWRQPGEMSGVWDHPLKLLDGFWFGIATGKQKLLGAKSNVTWLTHADRWSMTPGEVAITYHVGALEIIRREYGVNDHEGIIVQLDLTNHSRKQAQITLTFLARTDLRAAWLGENRLAWRDGRDEAVYLDDYGCIAAYNTINPAYVFFGATKRPVTAAIGPELWATQQTRGQGMSGQLRYTFTIPAAETVNLVCIITGSTQSSSAALATYQKLRSHYDLLIEQQRTCYTEIIERCALHCGDQLMEAAFGWAKAQFQMLERHVPNIGRGLAAGLPDFPWWFADDIAYCVLPLVASGQFALAQQSLRTIHRYSEAISPRGQIVHEVLTQGHVYDPGHLVETPLFVRAVYHTYCWTGDFAFLDELYSFCKQAMLEYVLGTCDPDGDLCPRGKSLVETLLFQHGEGFETIDIASYTYEALLCLAAMADAMGDTSLVPRLNEMASRLREHLNSSWWIENEGLFGDIYASADALAVTAKALLAEKPLWPGDVNELERTADLVEDYAFSLPVAGESRQTERPWLLKHMIAAVPMETGLASMAHAEKALARLESEEFNGPWGILLNPHSQAVTMTLPNGIMAAAEAQYHRMDQALAYSQKIAAMLPYAMPGAFSEVSPDKACFAQAWSGYGIIWPVVHFFFCFRPNAAQKTISFMPHLPSVWTNARLDKVRVGSASMNLAVNVADQAVSIHLETSEPQYAITFGCPCKGMQKPTSVTLNGESIPFEMGLLHEQTQQEEWGYVVQSTPAKGLHKYEFIVSW
jgi:glycogen debranching enzyme